MSNPTLKNGRHVGESITRVPVSYLFWMVNAGHEQAEDAREELKRRGSSNPTCEITGHAIDRASMKCLAIWQADRTDNEGLNAWLLRITQEALEFGQDVGEDKYIWKDMQLVIRKAELFPVLVTIMLVNKELSK